MFFCAGASVSWRAGTQVPVYVTASFTDRNNLFIEDLSRDEIQILENGNRRTIELFAKDELPTVYALLFDRDMLGSTWESYSARSRVSSGATSSRDLAFELIDKYLGRHMLWIGVYDRELEEAYDFGGDGFRAKDCIQGLRGNRRPAESFLFGALIATIQKLSERPEKRRILLLFLDEVDIETADKVKPLKNLLSSSNVELFVVCFATKLGSRRAGRLHPQMTQGLLRDLAGVTAGECFMAADYREHLDDITRRVYNQMRTLYTFGYQSSVESGKVFTLEILCSRQRSKVRHHPSAISGS